MSDHLLGTLVLVEANDWRKLLKVSSEEDELNFDLFVENQACLATKRPQLGVDVAATSLNRVSGLA